MHDAGHTMMISDIATSSWLIDFCHKAILIALRLEKSFNPINTGLFYLVIVLGGSPPSIKFDPDILEL